MFEDSGGATDFRDFVEHVFQDPAIEPEAAVEAAIRHAPSEGLLKTVAADHVADRILELDIGPRLACLVKSLLRKSWLDAGGVLRCVEEVLLGSAGVPGEDIGGGGAGGHSGGSGEQDPFLAAQTLQARRSLAARSLALAVLDVAPSAVFPPKLRRHMALELRARAPQRTTSSSSGGGFPSGGGGIRCDLELFERISLPETSRRTPSASSSSRPAIPAYSVLYLGQGNLLCGGRGKFYHFDVEKEICLDVVDFPSSGASNINPPILSGLAAKGDRLCATLTSSAGCGFVHLLRDYDGTWQFSTAVDYSASQASGHTYESLTSPRTRVGPAAFLHAGRPLFLGDMVAAPAVQTEGASLLLFDADRVVHKIPVRSAIADLVALDVFTLAGVTRQDGRAQIFDVRRAAPVFEFCTEVDLTACCVLGGTAGAALPGTTSISSSNDVLSSHVAPLGSTALLAAGPGQLMNFDLRLLQKGPRDMVATEAGAPVRLVPVGQGGLAGVPDACSDATGHAQQQHVAVLDAELGVTVVLRLQGHVVEMFVWAGIRFLLAYPRTLMFNVSRDEEGGRWDTT